MPISNLNSTHLEAANITAAQDALTQLETALAVLNLNLTADDRRRYGSINEQNKLFVNKVLDYANSQPGLRSPEVDWNEFTKDHSSRQAMEAMIARLVALITKLENAKVLHDYDNYQAALTDYAYTNYKAGSSAPGYENKQKELKQFFAKTKLTPEPTPEV